jgi:hypothetical protein
VITISIFALLKRPDLSGLFLLYQRLAALRRRFARIVARAGAGLLQSVTKIELSGSANMLTQVSTMFVTSRAQTL